MYKEDAFPAKDGAARGLENSLFSKIASVTHRLTERLAAITYIAGHLILGKFERTHLQHLFTTKIHKHGTNCCNSNKNPSKNVKHALKYPYRSDVSIKNSSKLVQVQVKIGKTEIFQSRHEHR